MISPGDPQWREKRGRLAGRVRADGAAPMTSAAKIRQGLGLVVLAVLAWVVAMLFQQLAFDGNAFAVAVRGLASLLAVLFFVIGAVLTASGLLASDQT